MKNTIVSKFQKYSSVTPENINLWDWFNDSTHKEKVEQIRSLTDKEQIRNLKSQLPAITVSGTFAKRKRSELIKHSGYICIDIDAGDNPHINNFKHLRNELKNITNVAYASLSVSGKGVYCLIPLEDIEQHQQHFEALKIIFKTFDITIDKACGDITRLRGYSYDEDAFYNESAEVFTQKYNPKDENNYSKKSKTNILREVSLNLNKASKNNNQKNHSKVLAKIIELNNKEIDITKDYNDWLQISSAFANEFGEEGRELFHLVSQNNVKYKRSETDTFFSQRLETPYGYNIGTFFHLAKEALKLKE